MRFAFGLSLATLLTLSSIACGSDDAATDAGGDATTDSSTDTGTGMDTSTPTDTGTPDAPPTDAPTDTAVVDAGPPGSAGCVDGAGLDEGEHTFMLEDRSRRYILRLPNGYTRDRAWPLVLALHGNGGSTSY